MSAEEWAGLVGAIIAKLGLAATEMFLKQMLAVALAMATFIGTKVIPKAGAIAAGEYAAIAQDLIAARRAVGVTLKDADAGKIMSEIVDKSSEIEPVIKKLASDLR